MTKKEYASRYLYGKIQSGEFKVGEKLPSENSLAIKLKISRLTAREAFKSLESNGIIHGLHGKGYFVSDAINELSFGSLKNKFKINKTKIKMLPDIKVESFFGIKNHYKEGRYISYEKTYFSNGKLKIATISFLNRDEVWNFKQEEVRKSLLNFLIHSGVMPSRFKETIIFGNHPLLDNLAKELGYTDRYPIFITRLKTENNVNIEYALRIYDPIELKITNTYKII